MSICFKSVAFIILIILSGPSLGDESSLDLAIDSLELAPSGNSGGNLYCNLTISNLGTQISMTDTVRVYLSKDQEISDTDNLLGSAKISFLRPGKSTGLKIVGKIPDNTTPGIYHAGALLTMEFALNPDKVPENNLILGRSVNISSEDNRPDDWYAKKVADLIFDYSNEERRIRNLNPFVRDSALDQIALAHSQDMATRDFFDHINPDGEDQVARAERYGYDQEKVLESGEKFVGIGENIVKIPVGVYVYRYGSINPDDPDQVAQVAVRSFIESPPHKVTLLLPEHEVIGIGVAFDGIYYYATQNFF